MLLVLQPYQPTMLKFEIVFYVFLENLLNVLGTKYQSGTTFWEWLFEFPPLWYWQHGITNIWTSVHMNMSYSSSTYKTHRQECWPTCSQYKQTNCWSCRCGTYTYNLHTTLFTYRYIRITPTLGWTGNPTCTWKYHQVSKYIKLKQVISHRPTPTSRKRKMHVWWRLGGVVPQLQGSIMAYCFSPWQLHSCTIHVYSMTLW